MTSLTIAGKTYWMTVTRTMPVAGVAFLIPCHNGFHLTKLAVDAIRAFTQDVPHEIWVIDNVSSRWTRHGLLLLAEADRINLILNHTRPWPWWRRPNKFGSRGNGVALEIASKVMPEPRPARFFVMHNDCLPIRAGWLTELDRSRVAQGAVAIGVREDPHPTRIHAMHQSGFLMPGEIAVSTSFLPHLPHLDAGDRITAEIRARGEKAVTTPWHPHREPRLKDCQCPAWLCNVACDVSTLSTFMGAGGEPFYVHKGGGSAMSRKEIGAWVTAAREALGLRVERHR